MIEGGKKITRRARPGRPPSGLAPSKKVLLRLYAEGGKSIREIGEILNCSKDMCDERQLLFPFDDHYFSRFCEASLFELQKLIFDRMAKNRLHYLT